MTKLSSNIPTRTPPSSESFHISPKTQSPQIRHPAKCIMRNNLKVTSTISHIIIITVSEEYHYSILSTANKFFLPQIQRSKMK